MSAIHVPVEGRPTSRTSSEVLVGIDGDAFCILGVTRGALKRSGASATFVEAYTTEATSADYDHLLAASIAYLDAPTAVVVHGFADNIHHLAPPFDPPIPTDYDGRDGSLEVSQAEEDELIYGRCPACGEPIDYCQGHGEAGDRAGRNILMAHDDGDHTRCHPDGCDERETTP